MVVLKRQSPHSLQVVQAKTGLRPHQLQLLARALHPWRARFGADANPVNAPRRWQAAIGLDGNLKALRVQRVHQRGIDLQQGLTAREDHKAVRSVRHRPQGSNLRRQGLRVLEPAAQRAVGTHKVSIAKLADRCGPVLLAARPQVAPGKAAKHCGLARVGAFALQGVEDFFDLVAHGAGRAKPARARFGVSRTDADGATAIAARFLYMVVLYMARK